MVPKAVSIQVYLIPWHTAVVVCFILLPSLCLSLAPSPLTKAVARPDSIHVTDPAPAPVIPEWKRALQEKKQKEQAVRDDDYCCGANVITTM